MKKLYLSFFFLAFTSLLLAQQKLLSPKEFLGYELGDQYTRHHRVIEYYEHVAEVIPNVNLIRYGETNEHRPLIYAVVTSPENFKNIEQIRLDNLKRTGLIEGIPSADKKAIVWLSYNVHGNEASSTEASMLTLYDLANPSNAKTQEWLKNTVVILDPCINPDGRDRFANWYNQYGNVPPNANPDSYENDEAWPSGRYNHYLFDLNRDWAWQTQTESQQRLKVYNQWMPHVHVDFHEQSPNSSYFFAPEAEPFHEVISPWQREFQVTIGKNHAKYFDKQGWLYFTKEVFDLYYPGYGDTYPTYNGAIGMTYEQAGQSGISFTTKMGDQLTLKDRLTHHYTTSLSTVEVTAQNAVRVADEFEKYFRENNTNPAALYKTYVIKAENNPDKINQLLAWMDLHAIRYGHPSAGKAARGFDYQTQGVSNFNLSTEDVVVNVYQPKSRFITAVFEPQSKLSDSLSYDITAWNLMYSYGLKAYALNERINVGKPYQAKAADNSAVEAKPYAYIFRYQSLEDVKFLGNLMQKGIKVRSSEKSFSIAGQNFERGTLIVTQRNNESVKDFDAAIQNLAREMNRKIFTTSTGFAETGKDLGSSSVNYLKAPRVALLFGDKTNPASVGQVWQFFEQQLRYPLTQLGTSHIKNADLKKYDVLIVTDTYSGIVDESLLTKISTWVSEGGRLIVIGSGLNAFTDKKGFELKHYKTEEEQKEAEKKEKELKEKEPLARYDEAERKYASQTISGAIYKLSLDSSHPLAFGLGDTYYSLKTTELKFSFLEKGWNVGVIKGKAKPVQGFAGYKANNNLDNTLVFGVEDKGQGNIVYMVDNPLFRCFWENGKMIFANAVFMVGQ